MAAEPVPSLHARLIFANRNDELYEREKPYSINYDLNSDIPRCNIIYEAKDKVELHNLRGSHLDFETHGIHYTDLASELSDKDFADEERVEELYLPKVRELLRDVLGTEEVYIFEYQLRNQMVGFPYVEPGILNTGVKQPVGVAHVDFTEDNMRQHIQTLFGDKGKWMASRPYQAVNVWRPINGPVLNWPLALCDPTSVDKDKDLLAFDDVFPNSLSEPYNVHHNENQRWYYLKDQAESEAFVFRQVDSRRPQAIGVPHCAFELYDSRIEGPQRNSIEIRAIGFYD